VLGTVLKSRRDTVTTEDPSSGKQKGNAKTVRVGDGVRKHHYFSRRRTVSEEKPAVPIEGVGLKGGKPGKVIPMFSTETEKADRFKNEEAK